MTITADLRDTLDEAVGSRHGVTQKLMFGCHAFFRNNQIFGLIWKTGRIGVRLPDEKIFRELMAIAGSEPWQVYSKPGAKPMAHWVLMPEEFHDDLEQIATWSEIAWQLAQGSLDGKKTVARKPVATTKLTPSKKKTGAVVKKAAMKKKRGQ
jgi:hypothetical protein